MRSGEELNRVHVHFMKLQKAQPERDINSKNTSKKNKKIYT